MSLPAIARVGVAAGWHASPSKNAPAVAHLMPTTWAADGRKSRPALCGERRQRWINHQATENPGRFDPCTPCLDRAAGMPPVGAVVQIAPTAPRTEPELVGRVSEPMQASTAVDRLHRRIAFRDELVVLSDRAEDYLDEQLQRIYHRYLRTSRPAPVEPEPVLDEDQAVDDPPTRQDAHRPLAYSTSS